MEKKLKIFLVWFWVLLGISLAISVLYFLLTFGKTEISNDPTNWGTFGDYFGGVTQSIIALANLIIFVKLTNLIAKHNQNQSDNELTLQKTLLLTQLRSEAVKNVSDKLNSFFEIIKDSAQKKVDLLNLAGHVDSFCKHNGHLFQLQSINHPVAKSLIAIVKCYEIEYPSPEAKLEDIKNKTRVFYSERDDFIRILQQQIIGQLK